MRNKVVVEGVKIEASYRDASAIEQKIGSFETFSPYSSKLSVLTVRKVYSTYF